MEINEYKAIAKKIVEYFPTESEETYYIPPGKRTDTITKKTTYFAASGKLFNKVQNCKKTLFSSGLAEPGKLKAIDGLEPGYLDLGNYINFIHDLFIVFHLQREFDFFFR